MHALIIEDAALIAWGIETSLRELGFTTFDLVTTESDAVSAAAKRCTDLIVADCNLAEGTGWQAVMTICADRIIPVVFIVGEQSYLHKRPWWSAIITKPYAEQALLMAIDESFSRAGIIRGVMGGEPVTDIFPQSKNPPESG